MSGAVGGLRHRVTLERPVRTSGPGGTASIAWTSAGSVFARIEPLGGSEIERADGIAARITHRILIRFRADIGAPMRIVEGPRVYAIRAVIDVEGRGRWSRCLCEEELP